MGNILQWTGNPFVDSGISTILLHCGKKSPQEIQRDELSGVCQLLEKIYLTENWKKNLFSVFPNAPLTNPANKTEAIRRTKYNELLSELLQGVESSGNSGDCIACGRRNIRSRKGKTYIPLTGSGSLLNFFSYTTKGADYCDTCTFAVQCAPLTLYACGKLALLHSNSPKIMRSWARKALDDVQRQIARNDFTGCFNEGYTNPQNALFHIVEDLILSLQENWSEENAALRLYHFTNYNQGPELDLYDLPSPVFRFLSEIKQHPRYRDWRRIVRRGYYFVKQGKQITFSVKGKAESEYRNNKNRIYQRLLEGKSILLSFINQQTRTAYGDYSLLTVYLREVLAMDKQRIETVKRVADEIADFIMKSDKGEKRLRNLEAAVKYRDFCNVLRRITKERIAQGAANPLFTLDEFAEQLFPEGALTFGETRYLILFRLYEQLHNWLRERGLSVDEAEDEIKEVADEDSAVTEN